MEIQTDITFENVRFKINEEAVLTQMIKNIIGHDTEIKDVYCDNNSLYTIYDDSYHGSANFKKHIFCTEIKKIKKFQLLRELLEIIKCEKQIVRMGY